VPLGNDERARQRLTQNLRRFAFLFLSRSIDVFEKALRTNEERLQEPPCRLREKLKRAEDHDESPKRGDPCGSGSDERKPDIAENDGYNHNDGPRQHPHELRAEHRLNRAATAGTQNRPPEGTSKPARGRWAL